MVIQTPRPFETSDKAHADLFNDMLETLLHNDTGMSEQITLHINDPSQHSSEVEKKKWNESQLYKITGDNGTQLLNISVGSRIFDSIKDKGTCTFYAPSGIEDNPSQYAIRGIQTVGQNNIGTGFAIDTSGSAYYFYYYPSHISINWTQLPTAAEQDKWNNSQLHKITRDNGQPFYKSIGETTDYNEIIETGMYLIYNAGLNGPKEIKRAFMIVISYGNTLLQTIYDAVNGLNSFYRIRKTDYTWTEWEKHLTSSVLNATWYNVNLNSNINQYSINPLKYSVRQNILYLRGSFEIVSVNETEIARLTHKPSSLTVFTCATVGSYGSARMSLSKDGFLKLDGLIANDPLKVTRIEMNEAIPLW
ncbi:pyocin knob domain-containing protein [Bacillus altitudinis]|uniref:pyocin knob domain-containing protein n=1 Tax=Bacillus altitudinis TaxID=293387 RepID=UPI0039E08DE9